MNASATGQHLLLGEFVIPVDAGDPRTRENPTEGLTVLWLSGTTPRLSCYVNGTWMTLGEEPVGTIKGYVGSAADIPGGWYICDGENGTPDFRGYFVLASSLEDAGVATDAGTLDISGSTGGPSAVTAGLATGGVVTPGSSSHSHVVTVTVAEYDGYLVPSYTMAYIMRVT
jgi:hypothetical protein